MSEHVSVPASRANVLTWEAKALAHVATIGPSGEPQTSPVWFDWVDGQLIVSFYENSQKMRNVKRDPRVAVSIVDPKDAYKYVEIRGEAVSFEPDVDLVFMNQMAKKYLGLDEYPWHEEGEVEVVVTITPSRVTGMGG